MESWKIELYFGSAALDINNSLYHYGTKGQKWGERHWQNTDGTFNEAGKQRYFGKGSGENYKPVGKKTKSFKGNMHRLAAKNYALNEKTYAKSNPTLASMNKAAKEEALKKAEAADKAKADRLANKKQLTPEQKSKIAKAAVGALAAAAVVGGTIYLAKTGKLDSVVNKGKEMADRAISKGKNTVIAGKFAAKNLARNVSIRADYAKNKLGKVADTVGNKAKVEARYAKYKVKSAIDKGKNATNRLIDKATYKKRLREAEAIDRAVERRQKMLSDYAKESLAAFNDPNVRSYTRNDNSIGYHEHWEKK